MELKSASVLLRWFPESRGCAIENSAMSAANNNSPSYLLRSPSHGITWSQGSWDSMSHSTHLVGFEVFPATRCGVIESHGSQATNHYRCCYSPTAQSNSWILTKASPYTLSGYYEQAHEPATVSRLFPLGKRTETSQKNDWSNHISIPIARRPGFIQFEFLKVV